MMCYYLNVHFQGQRVNEILVKLSLWKLNTALPGVQSEHIQHVYFIAVPSPRLKLTRLSLSILCKRKLLAIIEGEPGWHCQLQLQVRKLMAMAAIWRSRSAEERSYCKSIMQWPRTYQGEVQTSVLCQEIIELRITQK